MTRRSFIVACFLALSLCLRPAVAAPRIVASIEPLRDLAAALAAGVGEAQSLIPGHASIHHYALRPSQLVRLRDADLVIWIHRRFESGFDRIETLAPNTGARLELAAALGLDEHDYHLWYSPRLLRAAARLIAERLVALDQRNAPAYRNNLARIESALDARVDRLSTELRRDGPLLLTDHALLDAFAGEYGLAGIVALHDHHEGGGSLGSLHRLERLLESGPANCLLTSGAAASPLGVRLAHKYGLDMVSLLPDEPPDAALRYLDRLLDALHSCGLMHR